TTQPSSTPKAGGSCAVVTFRSGNAVPQPSTAALRASARGSMTTASLRSGSGTDGLLELEGLGRRVRQRAADESRQDAPRPDLDEAPDAEDGLHREQGLAEVHRRGEARAERGCQIADRLTGQAREDRRARRVEVDLSE